MLLYHISTMQLFVPKVYFYPRVPYSAADQEDMVTPRICFADSVSNAIQATGYNLKPGDWIAVYELDTSNLNSRDIIPPEILQAEGLVPDAMDNQEYWILQPVTLETQLAEIQHIAYKRDKHPELGYFTYITELRFTMKGEANYGQITGKFGFNETDWGFTG